MKKTQRKVPHNLVPSPKIDPVAHAQLNSKVDELTLKLAQANQDKSDQAKRHQIRVTELKEQIAKQADQLTPLLGVSDVHINDGFLVQNWKTGWKWVSNWMFVLIGFISVYGVPTEIVNLIPDASQGKVTAILAILGFICRFINQSRPKENPNSNVEVK
ncbi:MULTISPECIES: hypothetical protein [unclassified Acinetobacter]|uniref:DUF7940 domain-containing protein n=1 Tax=unclassified Acinetobacter TaxID=196816 RepID=UPI00190D495A|nr:MULTISPECIES: hypothetical protein [unclassified Acinetobacter]MBK0062401.1 hypothetical protein [Acinetobacter sp. S55]MBK0066205.1 hypothetical protein [Acinetobacter sp. S54]